MRNKIYLYELEACKQAEPEKRSKMRVKESRYFELDGFASETLRNILESFIWERGRNLVPSSLASELLYYNNIRAFLIDKKIPSLSEEDEEHLVRKLKTWMLDNGYALSSQKYRAAYDRVAIESSGIEKYFRKVLRYATKDDYKDEQDKDIWDLSKFNFSIKVNPIKNTKRLNFTKIPQADIREEIKKVVYMHLKYMPVGTILTELAAINRFCKYLKERYCEINSLKEIQRNHMEAYLIYLHTEASERQNFRSDLYSLKRILEDVGNLYEYWQLKNIFLNNDFPSTPRYQFKFYTDTEIKRLNEHIFQMDEQICRALMIHQLLGTRISDTLTLKMDCISKREGRYFVRIDQIKSVTYEKAVSDEVAQLIMKAMDYTKKRYGETTYIFVTKDDPQRPYQYSMIQYQIMTMIRQKGIMDDHGELIKFGTHIFRHCYGKKLTEMHVEDWMIAKLLGHQTMGSVHHYRKIGNKIMAEETRKIRDEMDLILLDIVKAWDDYEI